ncbi:MAG: AhpC/TSA family protein [Gammaproteobacteria bacterium]|nr:AhpC/TSA family protein [Gammaproteobacteria bacterium]
MKKLTLMMILMALLGFNASAHGLDRTKIAEKPAEVTPILIGETVPDVTLFSTDGVPFKLREKAAKQPTIVLFYRGGWCPFCNAQLSQIQAAEEQIRELGYQIIAISPDTPDELNKSITDKKLDYQLASDFSLETIRKFGLAFYVPKEYSDKIKSVGGQTHYLEGDSRSILPVPAVFILDQAGSIQFEYVNPNYKVRVNPQLLVDAARYALENSDQTM